MKNRIRINGKLYEAVEPRRNRRSRFMNESLGKPLTSQAARKYDLPGAEDLPDGSPALYYAQESSDEPGLYAIVSIYGVDDESGQIGLRLTDFRSQDDQWGLDFEDDEIRSAMKKFNQIAEMIEEGDTSLAEIARKFRMDSYDW